MEALAAALECSGVHVVWCVKASDQRHVVGDDGTIPNGFKDCVGDRAPQVEILRHWVVGAVVTHCGWNSVLESILTGVLMLTWPMNADQFTDAKLLVDQLDVAIRACEGGSQNVPNVLGESIIGSQVERAQVMQLRNVAKDAVKRGSSTRDLEELVKIHACLYMAYPLALIDHIQSIIDYTCQFYRGTSGRLFLVLVPVRIKVCHLPRPNRWQRKNLLDSVNENGVMYDQLDVIKQAVSFQKGKFGKQSMIVMEEKIWKIVHLAMLWSVWKLKNECVFKETKPDFADLIELVKVRVALWAKSNLKELKYSIHDIVSNLKQVHNSTISLM
ncbi:hypothetical protein HYC85_030031 [Camellia sinensis]|uniref:UDP-glycosyltransferases domain-containing protein n=1 Tax=Camellia sinensis TaxID=4442 RepID=A0A7J7FZI7_CAMSI|nr:hypothetical protein HYC85_030031 [Camellia sinensis]